MSNFKELQEKYELIEEQYKALRDKYLELSRSKRKEIKEALEEVKKQKHNLMILLEEEKLKEIEEDKLTPKLKKKLNKLHSKIDHEFWLEWTRSVWPFKETESDAKTGLHPAQFSAKLPEILIKFFSFVDDTVLDPFMGTGTTLEVARRLNRHSIGIDINPEFHDLTKRRLNGEFKHDLFEISTENISKYEPKLILGDARNMHEIKDNSIQLIVTHPPYWNAVRISDLENDLSNVEDDQYDVFLENMTMVFREMYRVLEPDRVAGVVIGDVMRKVNGVTQLYPIHVDFVNIARQCGFIVWDIYIWETKIRTSGGKPLMGSYPYPHKIFSQFAHNYVLVFRKQ